MNYRAVPFAIGALMIGVFVFIEVGAWWIRLTMKHYRERRQK